jgi:beta-N-acetylhexosaminidase
LSCSFERFACQVAADLLTSVALYRITKGVREDAAVADVVTDSALADMAAGLLMVGFQGTQPSELPGDLIAQCGGVILFRRNIKSAEQLRALVEGIRATPRADKLAPLIAIDQEGGTVSRLAGIGTTTPSAMALGAARDPSVTESMYRLIGDELAALGINLDLAPVADINDNADRPAIGLRSFGDDPAAVGAHVQAAIRGLHAAGVGACAKHFPGYGEAAVDPHLDLPSIGHDLARLRAVEFRPFLAAIAQRVDLIMSAHVLLPALEPANVPATLSRFVLSTLLREELRFEGVVCTDCMEMKAIADRYTPEQSAVAAVAAGADLVLFSHSLDRSRAARAALRDAVADGRLPDAQVRCSLERIQALRVRLAQMRKQPGPQTVGSEEHSKAALAAERSAITVVRDPKDLLPLRMSSGDKILVVQFAAPTANAAGADADGQPVEIERRSLGRGGHVTTIGRALAQGPARIHEQVRSLEPAGLEHKQLLMAAGTANAVVAVTTELRQHARQTRAVADLATIGKRVIVVVGREPYDAEMLPEEMTVIASFGEDAHAMRAAADVILGVHPARGTLPVRLNAAAGPIR